MSDNTILITGGGTGIGRGLAEAFHTLGNDVIIAGRRKEVLQNTVAANPGMRFLLLDIEDESAIREFRDKVLEEHQTLNVLINNAGIQHPEDLKHSFLAAAEATVTTNLLGPIRMIAAFLPHLLGQRSSAIVNVSSSLAFTPISSIPTYCATKAGLHSYTQSLREQLNDTSVEVIEIIPPWVQTALQGEHGRNPMAMALDDYIAATMKALQDHPNAPEVRVER